MTDDFEKMYTIEQIMQVTGYSRAYLYALMAKSEFPKPIKAGRRAARWFGSELRAWQVAKGDERETASVSS